MAELPYLIIASSILPFTNISGRGAVFTAYETIEMEASIMDGRTLEVSLWYQNVLKEKTIRHFDKLFLTISSYIVVINICIQTQYPYMCDYFSHEF